MNGPAISLSNVDFQYGGQHRRLFEGLTLDIPPGTITAILGPNGSGKTTLLHLILGLHTPDDGVILLARRPRHQYHRRALGKLIGLVSQNEALPFNFSVLDYVLLGRAPHLRMLQTPGRDDVAIARQVLTEVGMQAFANRSIQSLSGGERQLVMIARALAQRPRILLLDEPTSHLDVGNRGRVLRIMADQANRGITVVFTTHEPAIAVEVAAYAVLMRAGDALAVGPAGRVLTAENLSRTYRARVDIVDVPGQRVVVPHYDLDDNEREGEGK